MTAGTSERDGDDATSIHARRAGTGDGASIAWIIERFTPLLLAQARYRLGPGLRHVHDPADLVNDVWAIAIRRLPEIELEQSRAAATLVRFLSTTLLNHFRNLLKRHLRARRRLGRQVEDDAGLDDLPAETSGIVTRAVRSEVRGRIAEALAMLDALDREIVLLRGVEQASARDVGAVLGMAPNTVTVRYRRALKKLRGLLGESIFDELPQE